jgi:flagellar L-ring protein precursor FlgH
MNARIAKHAYQLLTIFFIVTLSACGTVPPTNVHQPMSARPVPLIPLAATPGAIYVSNDNTPLFEIKRARKVGDVLTILINEKTNATKKGNSSAQRSQTSNYGVSALAGLPGKGLLGSNLSASSAHKFDGKGETNANDTFSGIITVTVIEVFANGNLLVSGEKQTGVNQDTEFVRFSGVIDPTRIGFGNSISSIEVADAHIEYRGTGTVDSAQIMGWLAKFFLTFLPF